MRYVFQNFFTLVKNEKFIFSVMLVCVFISAWTMLFSYGLYQNYSTLLVESDSNSKDISIGIAEGETLTHGEVKAYLDELPDALLNGVNLVYCSAWYEYDNAENSYKEGVPVVSRFTVRDGVYKTSSYIADMWAKNGMIATGRYFTDEDEINGTRTVMVSKSSMESSFWRKEHKNFIVDDNTAQIFGQTFNIIGTHTSSGAVVPFLSLPSEVAVTELTLVFQNIVTRSDYETLVQTASKIAPGKMLFPELPFPDEEQISIYNNVIAISVLIAALTVINFSFLYNFIFEKRRRGIAIMRICGCTATRARAICIGECCLICIPVFAVGILTYIPFMKGVLSGIFVYMERSYTPAVYLAIFAIYVVMLLVIMGILLLRQIGQELSQGQKKEAG